MKKIIGTLIMIFTSLDLTADIIKGEQIYKENCAICHTINGRGGMGKDFNIVSYTRTQAKIEQYVKKPFKMYKEFGYSANAMPTLPLTKQNIKDVAQYISSLQPFKIWMKKR
jgi:mono/diheme cytochrome c family protein